MSTEPTASIATTPRDQPDGSSHPPSRALVGDSSSVPAPLPPADPPAPIKRRKQKPPKDSKVRKVALAYVAMKAQGIKLAEIAETLGYSKHTVSTYVKRAHARGWLVFADLDDPEDQLEVVLKSKAISNIHDALDDETRNEKTGMKVSTTVALEVAKGTGLLKTHQAIKNEGETINAFALKVQVEMAPGTNTAPAVRAGSIGGTPAIEAEIVEEGA